MIIYDYSNFGQRHFDAAAREGIVIEDFEIGREVEGKIQYATGTVTSASSGDVYNVRYKVTNGDEDTTCSCPACSQRSYFCKHMAAMLDMVTVTQTMAARVA